MVVTVICRSVFISEKRIEMMFFKPITIADLTISFFCSQSEHVERKNQNFDPFFRTKWYKYGEREKVRVSFKHTPHTERSQPPG